MTHYLALIHKEPTSCYGVSFPDVPGVVAAGDTLDQALEEAASALAFAAEDWTELTGAAFPVPRSFETLRENSDFVASAAGAVIAAVPLRSGLLRAA